MKFRGLIFANLFRKKLRLILTVGSFAVALFLFAFLAVVRDAFNRGADVAGADRLVVIDKVSIINLIPLKYRDQILQIPGVKSITHNNWFGGGSWEFNLDGIYHGERENQDETQFWFQWDYFEEKIPQEIKGQIGWYVIRVNNPDDAVRV